MIAELQMRAAFTVLSDLSIVLLGHAAVCRLSRIIPLDAWNRLQVLVDRANVVVRHVLMNRPGHDLQQISIERRDRWEAVRGYG